MRSLLGGKGANVAEMARIGVRVPDGFTVTTEACVETLRRNATWPEGLWREILEHLDALEERTGQRLGDPERPLLVSVRSGAVFSMPGMMDTILNLGIGDAAVEGLARSSGNERFAWDSYRRFLQMFGEVVDRRPGRPLRARPEPQEVRSAACRTTPTCTADDLRALVAEFRRLVREETGEDFPDDPREQLRRAVDAVFRQLAEPARRPSTGGRTASRTTSARPSTSCRWCSATSATRRRPASASRATRPRASRSCTASSCSTPRARTSSPASARRARSRSWRTCCRTPTPSCCETMERLESALRRHAGHRVHDRARHAVPAADALGQAHGAGGDADRARPRGRGRDHDRARRCGASTRRSSTSCCTR